MKISIAKVIEARPKWKVGQTVDVTTTLGRTLILSGHAYAVSQDAQTEDEKTLNTATGDDFADPVQEQPGTDQEEPPADESTASK